MPGLREPAGAMLWPRGWWLGLWLACAVASASASASVSALAAVSASAGTLPHERFRLNNGLDVILHVDRRLPLVAVDLTYHVGTMDDGEHPGLAHVVEHLMFRGTARMDDGELASRLYEAGARGTNASTHYDHTTYHTVVPTDQLPLALWLESDRMANLGSALTAENVAQEVRTTIDEWEDRVQSERHGDIAAVMWNALYPAAHPFRPAPPDVIARIRPEHVRRFVRRFHGPANATLVLAGDLPDDVRAQVQRAFGRRAGGGAPARAALPGGPRLATRRISHRSRLAVTPVVLVAWATPGLYAPGDAEADVLASTLNADRLRPVVEAEAPDTILSIEARQLSRIGQSIFVISAQGVASAEPLDMLAAIDAALRRVRVEPLAEGDVRRARRRFEVDALRSLQRLENRATRMQLYVAAGRSPDWVAEDLARYEAVDASAVARFARDYLPPEHRVVILARPAGAAP